MNTLFITHGSTSDGTLVYFPVVAMPIIILGIIMLPKFIRWVVDQFKKPPTPMNEGAVNGPPVPGNSTSPYEKDW